MSREDLQKNIDSLPREHGPMPYVVWFLNKKNKPFDKIYVRASSPDRARLTGIREYRYTFNKRNFSAAQASPDGWPANHPATPEILGQSPV